VLSGSTQIGTERKLTGVRLGGKGGNRHRINLNQKTTIKNSSKSLMKSNSEGLTGWGGERAEKRE